MIPMCEYCNRDDVPTYAHAADEVCAACLVEVFDLTEDVIAAALWGRPEGATYADVWRLS